MGTKLLDCLPIQLEQRSVFGTFSDFDHYVTADEFTTTASNSGTVAVGDGAGGIVTISASDASLVDEDETYLKGTIEIFKFATDKPLIFEARLKSTAANTACFLANNLIIGVKDAVAADSIRDTGLGPAASYSGALFFKADGSNQWNVESSVAGTQTTVAVTGHAIANSTYQTLRIEAQPISSTETEVKFFVAEDGKSFEQVGLSTAGQQFINHRLTHTSATEMQICLGIKAGASNTANTVPTLIVDYVGCWQQR